LYARSIGLGGSCPDSETVILLTDLLELEGVAPSWSTAPSVGVMDMTPCSHRAWITPAGVPHMTTPDTTTTGLPDLRPECY